MEVNLVNMANVLRAGKGAGFPAPVRKIAPTNRPPKVTPDLASQAAE